MYFLLGRPIIVHLLSVGTRGDHGTFVVVCGGSATPPSTEYGNGSLAPLVNFVIVHTFDKHTLSISSRVHVVQRRVS